MDHSGADDWTEKAMPAEDVDEYLASRGHGVLALAGDGDAYAIPVSFGYDGERLYFVLLRVGERSEKAAFVERTRRACFVTYDVAGKFDWRSVVVRGPLRPVGDDEWTVARDAIGENAWFPSFFSEAEPTQDLLGYVLEPDEVTGRRGR